MCCVTSWPRKCRGYGDVLASRWWSAQPQWSKSFSSIGSSVGSWSIVSAKSLHWSQSSIWSVFTPGPVWCSRLLLNCFSHAGCFTIGFTKLERTYRLLLNFQEKKLCSETLNLRFWLASRFLTNRSVQGPDVCSVIGVLPLRIFEVWFTVPCRSRSSSEDLEFDISDKAAQRRSRWRSWKNQKNKTRQHKEDGENVSFVPKRQIELVRNELVGA